MSDDNFDWPSHNLENAQLEENLDKIKRQVAEDYKKMTKINKKYQIKYVPGSPRLLQI